MRCLSITASIAFFSYLSLLSSCSESTVNEAPCTDCEDTSAFGVVQPDGAVADSEDNTPDERTPVTIEEALELLNTQRVASGLAEVVLNDDLSVGCEAHLDYMIGEQKVVHEQEPTSLFYTPQGAETGPRALIAGDVYDLRDALTLWTVVIYHRIALLDSGTQSVGLAFRDGYACLDPYGDWNEDNAKESALYPGNGQIGIPTTLATEISPISPVPADWPGPNGTVVSISFPPEAALSEQVKIELLSTTSGALIEGIVRHPNDLDDPYAALMGNTVALVPRSPLAPETTYRAEFIGTVDGTDITRIWTFTTAAVED